MGSDRKDAAYADVVRQILSLEIAPGVSLDEASLCERYGLSRTPLREVFQRLAGEGYVVVEANKGAAVSSMDLSVMRSFFQTAPFIYSAVARLAAEQATKSQTAALKTVQQRFRAAAEAGEADEMVMANHQFHEAIGEMAGNQYLLPSLKRLLIDHARMSHRFYRPRQEPGKVRVQAACDQHDEMIEAFATNDPALAAKLTLEHWELSRVEIEKYVRPDPLPMDAPAFATGGS